MARGAATLHAALYDDGGTPGDRPRTRRHGCRGILPELDRARAANHDGIAEFRYRRRVRHHSGDRCARRRPDAARADDRGVFRAVAGMSGKVSAVRASAAATAGSSALSDTTPRRIITGVAIVLLW